MQMSDSGGRDRILADLSVLANWDCFLFARVPEAQHSQLWPLALSAAPRDNSKCNISSCELYFFQNIILFIYLYRQHLFIITDVFLVCLMLGRSCTDMAAVITFAQCTFPICMYSLNLLDKFRLQYRVKKSPCRINDSKV